MERNIVLQKFDGDNYISCRIIFGIFRACDMLLRKNFMTIFETFLIFIVDLLNDSNTMCVTFDIFSIFIVCTVIA